MATKTNEVTGPASKGHFENKPLRELQSLANEVYGEGYMVTSNPSPTGKVVFLDDPTGEFVLSIDDPDCLEMMWVALIEKRKQNRKRNNKL